MANPEFVTFVDKEKRVAEMVGLTKIT